MPTDWLSFDVATTTGILVMAAVTFGLKLGGYATQRLLTPGPRISRFLAALPGTVILSMTVPMALTAGIAGAAGMVFGIALMAWTRSVLTATLVGYVMALGVRYLVGV